MIIQIEDYFGNDRLTLIYQNHNSEITKDKLNAIEEVASNCGYNIADVDEDENEQEVVRCQQIESNMGGKEELIKLVTELNIRFL